MRYFATAEMQAVLTPKSGQPFTNVKCSQCVILMREPKITHMEGFPFAKSKPYPKSSLTVTRWLFLNVPPGTGCFKSKLGNNAYANEIQKLPKIKDTLGFPICTHWQYSLFSFPDFFKTLTTVNVNNVISID